MIFIDLRDVRNFESDGLRHFFTNPNPTDLQTRFLTDSDLKLIFVLNFRKINCYNNNTYGHILIHYTVSNMHVQSFKRQNVNTIKSRKKSLIAFCMLFFLLSS